MDFKANFMLKLEKIQKEKATKHQMTSLGMPEYYFRNSRGLNYSLKFANPVKTHSFRSQQDNIQK